MKVNLVSNNPTYYKLKLPYLESLITVEEWWDFGGHRTYFSYEGQLLFAVIDGNDVRQHNSIQNQAMQVLDEIKNVFNNSIFDFIEKYEVQGNE